jgi:hypothetical protein
MTADYRRLGNGHRRAIVQASGYGLILVRVEQDKLSTDAHPAMIGQARATTAAGLTTGGVCAVTGWTKHGFASVSTFYNLGATYARGRRCK